MPNEPLDYVERIKWRLKYLNPKAYLADGLDAALIGYARVKAGFVALYCVETCVAHFAETMKIEEEEAREYFEFNVKQAHVGEFTPLYVEQV